MRILCLGSRVGGDSPSRSESAPSGLRTRTDTRQEDAGSERKQSVGTVHKQKAAGGPAQMYIGTPYMALQSTPWNEDMSTPAREYAAPNWGRAGAGAGCGATSDPGKAYGA